MIIQFSCSCFVLGTLKNCTRSSATRGTSHTPTLMSVPGTRNIYTPTSATRGTCPTQTIWRPPSRGTSVSIDGAPMALSPKAWEEPCHTHWAHCPPRSHPCPWSLGPTTDRPTSTEAPSHTPSHRVSTHDINSFFTSNKTIKNTIAAY